jgi:hypothetical protein
MEPVAPGGEGIVRSMEDRRALANQLLAAEPYRSLLDAYSYIAPDHLLWFVTQEALSRVKPPSGRHYMEGNPLHAVPGVRTALARLRHDQLFPSDVVFSVHELWHEEDRQDFLNEWAETGSPRLIFDYRDPRDQLISMIHFYATHCSPEGRERPLGRSRDLLRRKRNSWITRSAVRRSLIVPPTGRTPGCFGIRTS